MDFLQEFKPDLGEFYEKTKKFHSGELSKNDYKGFSGAFGSYAQRDGKHHMLRLRMTGGRLTKEKMKYIIDSTEKYGIEKLHLTTCQSVQVHDLEPDVLCAIIEGAWDAGMLSRGGGGDFPRNVMASPLSGVQKGENFDVLPYAEKAGEYLMGFIKTVKLPRKLKVCFSNSTANEPHATFRDLGFVSRPDGKFDVYSAGGLGNNPRMGVKVADAVEPAKILYYIKAMVDTFVAYGNYENRGKARTRYMQESLGTEGYVKAYQEKLAKVLAEESLDIQVEPQENTKKGNGTIPAEGRILAQKQDGLYAVYYQPIGGDLKPEKLKELYHVIKDMEGVEARITPEEAMYIINCNAEEAKAVEAVTADGANTLFETSVACIGSSICQVGVRDSQELLHACIEAVRKENFADGVLPKIHISGCPSSCSAHQIGDIAFRGGIKKTENGNVPGFVFFEGGCALQGKEVISKDGAAMATEDIPKFLVELGQKVAAENTTYAEWIGSHHEDLLALAAKYTA